MNPPYWTPNFAECPECGDDATDINHPEQGWFTCGCGFEFGVDKTIDIPENWIANHF